jgi:hypothetical protein
MPLSGAGTDSSAPRTIRGSRAAWPALAIALALLAATGAGCTRKGTPAGPGSGETPTPVEILEVSPAPRDQFVPYNVPEIWARFAAALDTSTVSPLNVYLKQDTRRIPISVRWDAPTNRIIVSPVAPLGLLQYYTVELSPNLRRADGVEFGHQFAWQFRTSSVRLPVLPFPEPGGVDESPFTPLSWEGGDSTAGILRYELFAGNDSTLVVTHSPPFSYIGPLTFYRPRQRWQEGRKVFWTVRVTNTATAERLDGPLWHFTPLVIANVPQDSLVVPYSQWGYNEYINNRWQRFCGTQTLVSGLFQNLCLFDWSLSGIPFTTRITAVRIELSAQQGYQGNMVGAETIASTTARWICAQMTPGGPPFPSETLVGGIAIGSRTMRFESDALAIQVAARLRKPDQFSGYMINSLREIRWVGP